MFGKKNKTPLPPKSKEEMPFAKMGLSLKEWRNNHVNKHKWRTIRWSVLIGMNLLFIISITLDLALLEGSLSGSRLLGFYLMDPYNTFQVLVISFVTGHWKYLTMNFVIGFFTIFLFYFFAGGRSYCSWICPYHFLAEWGEKLHDYLVKKKKIKEHSFNIYLRFVFWGGFLVLALFTKNIVFEDLNPIGILSRAMIYGPGLILLWILALLVFEIVYSKRFWCRYVCPVGATWSLVGKGTPLAIRFDLDKCAHCLDCQQVCLVPHELWFVKKGTATHDVHHAGSDCTRCGLCVDVCPGNALSYTIKGWEKIL
ncbi:MAG: NapH/MauN family ferredoxin-type protein [Chlorobi bacterium]|nr:NapH/MauN family ferredoxin-type protein [Chlorobiota bacterium]